MILKNFVVFEGIDGAGTSTQIKLLKKRPEAANFVFTAEPTSCPTGKFLRQVLGGKIQVSPQSAAYLFSADRAEHLWGKDGIAAQCKSGKIVVSDRYFFSSLAYQGVTCGEELPQLINSPFPLPQILFFFDIKTGDSLKRIDTRGEKKEIYENQKMLEATRRRYKKILSRYKSQPDSGMKIVTLDATQPKEVIAQQIWNELEKIKNTPSRVGTMRNR